VEQKPNIITFLGTAGARFMVIQQLLASGGAWLELNGKRLLLDPGPGSLVKATKKKLDPTKLDAIILSHKHLDHSVDINIMIEAMTQGGFEKKGTVFAPADALDGEAVILPYLREYPEKIELLSEGKTYHLGDLVFETPVRHRHPVETYGFIFRTGKHTVSWIIDTGYFDGLSANYTADMLILNVVLMERKPRIDHLSLPDAKHIIEQIKPKVTILTHYGMGMWKAKPWEVTQRLSEETGVHVIAARDGMKFDVDKLEVIKQKPGFRQSKI
jgi:ribonuclease BN (tRNA processing enzyme)